MIYWSLRSFWLSLVTILVGLEEKHVTSYQIMPLAGIAAIANDLNALKTQITGGAIKQSVPQKLTYLASFQSILVLCFENGSVNFIDFNEKTEKTMNNVLETVM